MKCAFWLPNIITAWMLRQRSSQISDRRNFLLQNVLTASIQDRRVISIVKPTRCTNVSNYFILFLFWNDILHVSDGLSVYHQEFKTVHTASGICQTDTAVCLLAGKIKKKIK